VNVNNFRLARGSDETLFEKFASEVLSSASLFDGWIDKMASEREGERKRREEAARATNQPYDQQARRRASGPELSSRTITKPSEVNSDRCKQTQFLQVGSLWLTAN